MGWRHERVKGDDYDRFIERFVDAVQRAMPNVFLHWEDFSRDVAEKNLERYRDRICSFNDDIQGTAAVCQSALLAALDAAGEKIEDQRVVIFGAGAAGLGNAGGVVDAMVRAGLSEADARSRIWALDRYGLVVEGADGNTAAQRVYARPAAEVAGWKRDGKGVIDLAETAARIGPTILVGTSGQSGAFTEQIVRGMAAVCRRPILFPLSNPTPRAEAKPADLLAWTDGRALIATGSPFDPVEYGGKTVRVGQSNNAFVFPGVTLGVIATKATKVTDNMLWAAAQALSKLSPARRDPAAGLLPEVTTIRAVCRDVGTAVAQAALEDGVARLPTGVTIEQAVGRQLWQPVYLPVRRAPAAAASS
jgi:malate dehydrogenase (oxaloacetate-decarboxylating)